MKKEVALVLSSGGPRGFAYIGAIEELENRGYTITSVAGTSIGSLIGGIYAAGRLDDLKEWVESVDNPSLIVIDTLQKIRGVASARVNAYVNDYKELAKLKAFADENHVAVVCIHHLNKVTNTDDSFNKVSGSTGVTGTADTTIIIERERGSDDAILSFYGRDVHGDDIKLRMQDGRWQAVSAEAAARES